MTSAQGLTSSQGLASPQGLAFSQGLTAAGKFAFGFLWLFVLSFPAEKVIDLPGLGTISRMLGALALGAGLVAVLIDARVRVLTAAHGVLALFVLWSVLTIRWSLAPDDTAVKAQTLLQLLGMAWLIWEFCPTEIQITNLKRAYVLGTFYAAFDTLSRFLLARQTYYQRYAAEGFEPNDMALTMAISLPISYGLAVQSKGWRAAVYWTQLALAMMTILLSASRSGFLASCLAASMVPLTFRYLRRKQRRAIVTVAVLGGIVAVAMVPASSFNRLSTIGAEVSSGSLNSRSMIWKAGWQVFHERPFEGVGSGAYPRSVEPMLGWPSRWRIVAHNTFFSVLVETGVAGFFLFAVFLAMLVSAIRRMNGLSRIVWSMTVAAWFLGVNSLSWEIRKPTWMIFALVLAEAGVWRTAARWGTVSRWRIAMGRNHSEVVLP